MSAGEWRVDGRCIFDSDGMHLGTMNESADARACVDARADIARLKAENEALRAEIAVVRRNGWIAGRDAADVIVTAHADAAYEKRESYSLEREAMLWQYYSGASTLLSKAKYHVRALTPPEAPINCVCTCGEVSDAARMRCTQCKKPLP